MTLTFLSDRRKWLKSKSFSMRRNSFCPDIEDVIHELLHQKIPSFMFIKIHPRTKIQCQIGLLLLKI